MRASRKNLQGLHDLCEYLKIHNLAMRDMLEVGTYMGESAAMFVLYFENVHCVDPWDDEILKATAKADPPAARVEEIFDGVAKQLEPRIIKHKALSVPFSRLICDESLDFVYIDGDHRADAVRDDISAWLPKVKLGCYIGGHDYRNPNAPEVADVVDEMLGAPEAVFMDHSWLVKKETNQR